MVVRADSFSHASADQGEKPSCNPNQLHFCDWSSAIPQVCAERKLVAECLGRSGAKLSLTAEEDYSRKCGISSIRLTNSLSPDPHFHKSFPNDTNSLITRFPLGRPRGFVKNL